jgi:hypothetical protein
MGNSNVVLPDSSPSLVKAVTLFHLTKVDCQKFCRIYYKLDVARVGKICVEAIFGYFGHSRTPFTDGLLDLIDVNHNGHVDFGQFVLLIATYCMFEEKDILVRAAALFHVLLTSMTITYCRCIVSTSSMRTSWA